MRFAPTRILAPLVATLLVASACSLTLPAQSTPAPSAGTYATAKAALDVLIERHIDKPSSQVLLGAAVADVQALVQQRGTPVSLDPPAFTGDRDGDYAKFSDFLDKVAGRSPSVAKAELERAAVNGMAKSLHECHTYYLDPERAKNFNSPVPEQYSGIGARISQPAPNTDSLPEITQVFKDSPADKAGVRPGDRIKTVNDKSTAGLTAEEVASMIKGPEGTQVRITVLRESSERSFGITRATVRAPPLDERLVGNAPIGYVFVAGITSNIPRELADALGRLDQAGAKGWIIDLRGDPGGDLVAAELVASTFIKSGVLLYEVGRDGQATPQPVNPKAYYPRAKPLAVLVNRASASGSEIIASAIQEHKAGRIFGEPTAGCISVAQPRELPDGGLLLYTFARVQSGVTRTDLSGKGVTPDELLTRSASDTSDKVLDAAIAWLRTQTQ